MHYIFITCIHMSSELIIYLVYVGISRCHTLILSYLYLILYQFEEQLLCLKYANIVMSCRRTFERAAFILQLFHWLLLTVDGWLEPGAICKI